MYQNKRLIYIYMQLQLQYMYMQPNNFLKWYYEQVRWSSNIAYAYWQIISYLLEESWLFINFTKGQFLEEKYKICMIAINVNIYISIW